MKVFGKKRVAAIIVAGLALASCGGSGDSVSDSTAVKSGRIKNSALTTIPSAFGALSCAQGGQCKIGDKGPGGGLVFYVGTTPINAVEGVSTGGLYMEFLDLSTEFGNGAGQTPSPQWGCKGMSIPATQSPEVNKVHADSVGKGAQNTKAIVDACKTAGIPAAIALNLDRNGQSDWFLPSRGELNQVCWFVRGQVKGTVDECSPDLPVVRTDISTQPLENLRYWSSTEGNGDYARTFSFNATTGKDGKLSIYSGGVRKDTTYPNIGVVRSFGRLPTCKEDNVCKVGDVGPGGGIVFYVGSEAINQWNEKYPGGKYMEFLDAYPESKSVSPCAKKIRNGELEVVGAGARNTALLGGVCSDTNPINIARKATNGGKSDWFIPSRDELNLICRYSRGQSTETNGACDASAPNQLGARFTETFWSSSPVFTLWTAPFSMSEGKSVSATRQSQFGFLMVRAFG